MRIILILSLLALSGCAHGIAAITCVPNVGYSDKTKQQAASELEQMGLEYPTVRRFVTDYGNVREANRRCAARKGADK